MAALLKQIGPEQAFLLFVGIWPILWIGVWAASRGIRWLVVPRYVAIPVIAVPSLAGMAMTIHVILGLAQLRPGASGDATFAVVSVVVGLFPLVFGVLLSLGMTSVYLWATGPKEQPADAHGPSRVAWQAIKQVIFPNRPGVYMILVSLATVLYARFKWPDAFERAASSHAFNLALLTGFSVFAVAAMIILRRRPQTWTRHPRVRNFQKVAPWVVPWIVGFTCLEWLQYLAERLDWDARIGLVLIGVAVVGYFGFQFAWIVLGIRRQLARQHPQEPRCGKCGYILYHASGGRCPECGGPFDVAEIDMRRATVDESGVIRPK